jgi:hypothetical protein
MVTPSSEEAACHVEFIVPFAQISNRARFSGSRLEKGSGRGPPSGHLTEAALRMAGGIGRMRRPDWRRGLVVAIAASVLRGSM